MRWFKFYGQDYLSDPKMLALSSDERSCWITLLCYASVNDNGMITHLSEQQLMQQAGLDFQHEDWNTTVGVLKKLENLEMIRIDNGMITVLNWNKRQETNLTSYERVKRHREKKRNDNAMITLEENRIEENNTSELGSSRGGNSFLPGGASLSDISESGDSIKPRAKPDTVPEPEIRAVFDLFGKDTYALIGKHKPQRDAVKSLLKTKGMRAIQGAMSFYSDIKDMEMAPEILKPYDLASKWAKLTKYKTDKGL